MLTIFVMILVVAMINTRLIRTIYIIVKFDKQLLNMKSKFFSEIHLLMRWLGQVFFPISACIVDDCHLLLDK